MVGLGSETNKPSVGQKLNMIMKIAKHVSKRLKLNFRKF